MFIKPSEFDFVEHWNHNDKKYIASFFSIMSNKYRFIENEEYKSYLRYIIFLEYKKHQGDLKVNSSLLGKLRVLIYRLNKEELEVVLGLNSIDTELFKDTFYGSEPLYIEIIILDIEKLCCKKTATALSKKINKEKLTRWEYALLQQNMEKILEYLSI